MDFPSLPPSQIRQQLELEERHTDSVLSLLMPPAVMEAAKDFENGSICFAERFEDASILFVEIALFTDSVAETSPERTMGLLNTIFWELDELTEAAGLLKVETVGSVYMVRPRIRSYICLMRVSFIWPQCKPVLSSGRGPARRPLPHWQTCAHARLATGSWRIARSTVGDAPHA